MPEQLSGGQKKRVGLARALVRDPEIILYDEPTSGLDPLMSRAIDDLIVSLKRRLGVTSVVVTHDMVSAFRVADRIGLLHEGTIYAEGTPAELQASTNPLLQEFIRGAGLSWKKGERT